MATSGSGPSSGRGKKASEDVPVESKTTHKEPAAQTQQPPSRRSPASPPQGGAGAGSTMAPFMGGGLASVLPRMMLSPALSPGGLLGGADPFATLLRGSVGPFGVADRLLHDLEDEIGSMLLGGEQADDQGGALAEMMPGRLWAAVDVKETPTEFILSTDVSTSPPVDDGR